MMVLELGCGSRREYPGSIGVDKRMGSGADIVLDLEDTVLPFENDFFDLVYAAHVLEHIRNLDFVVREVYRVLKPGGVFRVVVPHFSGRAAVISPEHIRFFCMDSFKHYDPVFYDSGLGVDFMTEKIVLRWGSIGHPLKILASRFISFLGNLCPQFCERIWVYWVGGFEEVEYILRKK